MVLLFSNPCIAIQHKPNVGFMAANIYIIPRNEQAELAGYQSPHVCCVHQTVLRGSALQTTNLHGPDILKHFFRILTVLCLTTGMSVLL